MRTSHLRRAPPAAQEWGRSWTSVGAYGLNTGIPGPRNTLTWEYVLTPDNFTIFEGTSEIQRLIISRAISGVHIK